MNINRPHRHRLDVAPSAAIVRLSHLKISGLAFAPFVNGRGRRGRAPAQAPEVLVHRPGAIRDQSDQASAFSVATGACRRGVGGLVGARTTVATIVLVLPSRAHRGSCSPPRRPPPAAQVGKKDDRGLSLKPPPRPPTAAFSHLCGRSRFHRISSGRLRLGRGWEGARERTFCTSSSLTRVLIIALLNTF